MLTMEVISHGFLGMGRDNSARIGDRIRVLYGCSVPVMLRYDAVELSYKFVV